MTSCLDKQKRALIFCPDISGHRQIYSYVLADWLLNSGYAVVIAAGRLAGGGLAKEAPLMRIFANNPNVASLDLGDITGRSLVKGGWVNTLIGIESQFLPEWTFLPTGDELRVSLGGLGKATLKDRAVDRAAFFVGRGYYYPREYYGIKLIKRSFLWFHWQIRKLKENYYFKKSVWNSMGLSLAFTPDPYFKETINDPRFYYIPDIYQAPKYAAEEVGVIFERFCVSYKEFLATHSRKDVILYFGTRDPRRGYDSLLRLCVDDGNTVFVSCGRRSSYEKYAYDVEELRSVLKSQNRIFEVDMPFFQKNTFFDLLFNSVKFVLLPYMNFYQPSGMLVQAASYGKPVLVPSAGYMGYMVNKYKFGLIYRSNDYKDFVNQFNILRREYPQYCENSLKFSSSFDRAEVDKVLAEAVLNKDK